MNQLKLCVLTLPLILFLAGCPGTQDPVVPTPPPPDPEETSWCDAAGKKVTEMKCPQALTPDGRTWAQVCKDRAQNGIDLHPKCIATNAKVVVCDDINPVCTWGTK
jgi:nitrous oxide reductase accessory protein NosL